MLGGAIGSEYGAENGIMLVLYVNLVRLGC